MNYKDKDIKLLSDDELREAILNIAVIDKSRIDKLARAKERHKSIFDKNPPVENTVFTNLATELNNEFKSRNLKAIITDTW